MKYFTSLFIGVALTACATYQAKTSNEAAITKKTTGSDSARLDAIDKKIELLNEKIKSTNVALENYFATREARLIPAKGHAAEGAGKKLQPLVDQEPERGIVNDAGVQSFRKGLIAFDSKQYAQAISIFGRLLRDYADHPLADSAQFFLAESYYQQKMMKQANTEFQKLLISYDKSSHIPEALNRLSHTAGQQDPKMSRRYDHLLKSLFPQSPAAKGAGKKKTPTRSQSKPEWKKTKIMQTVWADRKTSLQAVPDTAPMRDIQSTDNELLEDLPR